MSTVGLVLSIAVLALSAYAIYYAHRATRYRREAEAIYRSLSHRRR